LHPDSDRWLSNETRLGRLLRLPLRLLPAGTVVPILSGPLGGRRWIVGAGPHSYWLGNYEADKQRLLQKLLREGDCFLDIGANVGFHTLLAAALVGRSGRVVAFEPLPQNLAFLRRHLLLNRIRNVTAYEAAVSDAPGMVTFNESCGPSMGRIDSIGSLTVQAVTLDDLWHGGEFPPPRAVKIDVEGAEDAVLRGAAKLLAAARPVVVLSGHGWSAQQNCTDLLSRLGYRPVLTRDGRTDGMYESVAYPPGESTVRCTT
jgi:FkbM family methyltransferase